MFGVSHETEETVDLSLFIGNVTYVYFFLLFIILNYTKQLSF